MVGSVNTNLGAQIALQNLNVTGSDLASVQKQISTGLKVSDALDNGAVFAIAQGLRSDVSAISAVNGQLGAAKGLLQVAMAAATGVQNTFLDIRSVLTQLADQNVTGNARAQLNAQYLTLFNAMQSYVFGADYNGSNLLIDKSGSFSGYVNAPQPFGFNARAPFVGHNHAGQNVAVIQDISANQFTLHGADFVYIKDNLQSVADATQAQTVLTSNFVAAQDYLGTVLNQLGADSHFIDSQITLNNAISDATVNGIGALVDADLAKQSAKLQSLQIKQQLGTQSLGIANQAQQSLLSLFR